ncbi:MAG: regulatory protein RecX, partial [Alphaproteobacteria bacterium]|nr:regulatory protein RecX [Alphaproteobacteria bacterium]
ACGLLNDKTYANALVSTMRRKGLSRRAIQIKMRSKGIGSDLALCSLEDLDSHSHETSEDAEFSAALTLARKKKIGAFSCGKEQNIQKSFGVLARAGFSYDIAKRVLNISLEELENDPYN